MPTAAMRSCPKDGPSLPAGPVDVTAATKPWSPAPACSEPSVERSPHRVDVRSGDVK